MAGFFNMPEKDMILLSAAIAVLLADSLSTDEQNTLGNFLMCVGQDIILGAGQKELRENNNNPATRSPARSC